MEIVMMRLLGKAESINVRKVLWTLTELGDTYVREDWGVGYRATSEPEFLALNANAMVPVLVDDDFVLWESNSICRYLVNRAARTDLLPTEARARADVEKWMDWQATELNYSWRYAFMAIVRHSEAHQDRQLLEASIKSWNNNMQLLNRRLEQTGAYVAGTGFTLADIVLGLSAYRWQQTPMARPSLPAVEAYLTRLKPRRGFSEFVANGMP
jgi:glutathione S-transferase